MRNIVFTILATLSLLMFSCSTNNEEDLNPGACNTEGIIYETTISEIMTLNCAFEGCHIGPNAVVGLDLSSFEMVEEIANNGKLVGRITGGGGPIMPPPNFPPLPACDIDKIIAWIDDGTPRR